MFHCNMECLLIWATLLVSVAPLSNLPCWIFYTLSCELKRWAKDKIGSPLIQEEETCAGNLCVHMIREELTSWWQYLYIGTTPFSGDWCCETIPGSFSVTVTSELSLLFCWWYVTLVCIFSGLPLFFVFLEPQQMAVLLWSSTGRLQKAHLQLESRWSSRWKNWRYLKTRVCLALINPLPALHMSRFPSPYVSGTHTCSLGN